jgi:hypothetical protein
MSTLRFINGPAQGQTVEISVEPTPTRWFCELKQDSDRAAWWWVIGRATGGRGAAVTRYEVEATMPDPENEGETIYTYGVKDG